MIADPTSPAWPATKIRASLGTIPGIASTFFRFRVDVTLQGARRFERASRFGAIQEDRSVAEDRRQKSRNGPEIPATQASRFACRSEQPLESAPLDPPRRLSHVSGKEI